LAANVRDRKKKFTEEKGNLALTLQDTV